VHLYRQTQYFSTSARQYLSTSVPQHVKHVSALENEVHRQHQKHEANEVIESEGFVLEEYQGEDDEYHQGYDFLDDFELKQTERPAEFLVADAIGGHHQHVFKERDAPADEYDAEQAEVLTPVHLLEFQMTIPREGHEGVGGEEKRDGQQCFHDF